MKITLTLTVSEGHVEVTEEELLENADIEDISEANDEDKIEAATVNLEDLLSSIDLSTIEDALEGEVIDCHVDDITFDEDSEIKITEE